MDKRTYSRRGRRLLLRGGESSPRQSYSEKYNEIHHYPMLFPEHFEHPPVTYIRSVGQVIKHERASNAPYLIPDNGGCQEIV